MWLLLLPLWSWRLRPYRLRCLCDWWSLLVFLNEKFDLWVHFTCLPFLTVPSQVLWQETVMEVLELVILTSLIAWVLSASRPDITVLGVKHQVTYLRCLLACLQCGLLCLTRPGLVPSQSAAFHVFHGFMEWVVGIFYITEACFDQFQFFVLFASVGNDDLHDLSWCVPGGSQITLVVMALFLHSVQLERSLTLWSLAHGLWCWLKKHFAV